MKIARIIVSGELLRQFLLLPDGTDILRIRQSDIAHNTTEPALDITVQSPGLHDLVCGCEIPVISPSYAEENGKAKFGEWYPKEQ